MNCVNADEMGDSNMAYSDKKESKLRFFLEIAAGVLVFLWLFGYLRLQQSIIFDYRSGTDVLLAFVLATLHSAISITYLAAVRLHMQIVWVVMNLGHAALCMWLLWQNPLTAGQIFAGVIPILNDLLLMLPALWFVLESRKRRQSLGSSGVAFFHRKEKFS